MKLRVLVLHGFASNGTAYAKRLGALRNACRDVAELFFPMGPHHVQALPSESNPEPGPVDPTLPLDKQPRGWWVREDDSDRYVGWEASAAELRKYCAEHGPFDGVLGFSQGASVASVFAAALEQPGIAPDTLEPLQREPLKFAIMVSGFIPRESELARLYDKPLQVPSLHIMGECVVADERRHDRRANFIRETRQELCAGTHRAP